MTGEHPSRSTRGPEGVAVLRERVIALRRDLDAHAQQDQRERDRIEREHDEDLRRLEHRLEEVSAQLAELVRTVGELKAIVSRDLDTQPIRVLAPANTGPQPVLDRRHPVVVGGAGVAGGGLAYALVEWALRALGG